MESTGIALLPSTAFGIAPNSLTSMLALIDFDGSQFFDSASTTNFPLIKQGIEKLCHWLSVL